MWHWKKISCYKVRSLAFNDTNDIFLKVRVFLPELSIIEKGLRRFNYFLNDIFEVQIFFVKILIKFMSDPN